MTITTQEPDTHGVLAERRRVFRALHERGCFVIPSDGSFAGLADLVPYSEVDGLFATQFRPQLRRAIEEACGRSESFDPDNVGDIAAEGPGHRG